MRIEVDINRKQIFVIFAVVLAIGGLFVVTAYGTSDPVNFGHTPSEINPGTFGGGSSSVYTFSGILGVGGSDPSYSSLYVTNYSSGGVAALAVSGSNQSGKESLDFIHDGTRRTTILYSPWTDSLEVNGWTYAGSVKNTVINRYGGNVGIGKSPTTGYKLDVDGNVIASGNVSSDVSFSKYACVRSGGFAIVNPATDYRCMNGIPLRTNVAINSAGVSMARNVVRTNPSMAAIFISVTVEPNPNQMISLDLSPQDQGTGYQWFTYASQVKQGSAGYGRQAQLTAFVPPGYSYRITSTDAEGPWTVFETTFA